MTKQKTFVFNDPVKLAEMLILRSVGYKTVGLGKRYEVDRSAVSHQCRKYKVRPGRLFDPTSIRLAIGRRMDHIVYKDRYDHILYEPINPGKRSYKQYLEDQKKVELQKRVSIKIIFHGKADY